jgi:DNA polymerase III sliding clamp (beta) subunit (PCNA family)
MGLAEPSGQPPPDTTGDRTAMTTRTARTAAASPDTLTGDRTAMTLTIDAAELRRIALAVEKSAAKDDSRPVLQGIHARIAGNRLTLAAADGFRLSTAHATLDESAAHDATAILEPVS